MQNSPVGPKPEEVFTALRAGGFVGLASISTALAECIERAHEALPEVRASPQAWAVRVQTVCASLEPSSYGDAFSGLDPEEQLLVAALSEGDVGALAVFEESYMPEVDRALRRFSLDADRRAEYRQQACVRMLVGEPPKPPRIQEFHGRGRLRGWIRTVTARLVLNGERDARAHEPVEELLDGLVARPVQMHKHDPRRRAQFQLLLRTSFRALSRRERTILRMRYLDSIPATALARVYKVHESTMSRWLSTAREELLSLFEGNAVAELGGRDQADELIALVESRVDLSLQGLFESEVSDVKD